MMHLASLGLAFLLPAAVAAIQLSNFLPQTQQLVGSAFGVLGTEATFDYVIIGGGTAGLTIANRLATTNQSVAVVEAGSFYELTNGNLSQVPAYAGYYSSTDAAQPIQPLVDWGFITAPQPDLLNRIFHYTQGKTLGGGSARNYMFYHRGTAGSYQKWADQVDDQSWTFPNILPYFKRSVNFTGPNAQTLNQTGPYDPDAFSLTGGPLHVSYPSYYWAVSDCLVKGLEAIGLARIAGFSSGALIGFARPTSTIDPSLGTRSSSETSFLEDALQRTNNLHVYLNTLAKKVNFDENKTATGVDVTTAGVSYTLNAVKEVIVSAGAVSTP